MRHKLPPNKTRKYITRSPLRYPGGKTRALDAIVQYIPADIDTMLAPFMGGGSIEIFMSARGVKVLGFDTFSPLVEFWQCLLKDKIALAKQVAKHYPLSKDHFYHLQQNQTEFPKKIERAAAYYVLNRSSFSGSTMSGGMSPGHPRFNVSSIDRLKSFVVNDNLVVGKADFMQSLRKHPDLFTYLDPPYLVKSVLYGVNGDAHKDFDHDLLAATLQKRDRWLLSYNDCEEIRELYKGYRLVNPVWKYSMSVNRSSKELLIFSHDLQTIAQETCAI